MKIKNIFRTQYLPVLVNENPKTIEWQSAMIFGLNGKIQQEIMERFSPIYSKSMLRRIYDSNGELLEEEYYEEDLSEPIITLSQLKSNVAKNNQEQTIASQETNLEFESPLPMNSNESGAVETVNEYGDIIMEVKFQSLDSLKSVKEIEYEYY